MGRTPKPLDAEQVYKMGQLGCTQQEIADFFGVSVDTIQRRFAAELTRARASRKMSIRRAQTIRAIRDRSDRMLIHLGAIELGQGSGLGGDELDDLLDEANADQTADAPGEVPG